MDDIQVVECPEYGIYTETIVDSEKKALYVTIDASNVTNVYVRVHSRGLSIFIDEEAFHVDFPEGIVVDPESVKKTYVNGVVDITARIIRS
jgi:hypothetical protein